MSECLGAAALERMAGGKGSDSEREHVAECARCGTELELLISFEAAQATAAESVVVRQMEQKLRAAPAWRPGREARWVWGWGVGLAGLAAMLFFGLWLRNPAGPVTPAEDMVRSGRIEGIAPAGDLAQVPEMLRWRGVGGAAAYEVRLTDVEEQTLWQSRTTEAVLALPPAARVLMTERKTLAWRIRALDARGVAITASATESFRVVTK